MTELSIHNVEQIKFTLEKLMKHNPEDKTHVLTLTIKHFNRYTKVDEKMTITMFSDDPEKFIPILKK